MRFPIILVLLSYATLISAQNYNSATKIDEGEKKRLENKFKALKTFYINDAGLVVYQKQADDSQMNTPKKENKYDQDTLVMYVKEANETDHDISVRSEEMIPIQQNKIYTPQQKTISSSSTDKGVVAIKKEPINPLTVKKQNKYNNIKEQPAITSQKVVAPIMVAKEVVNEVETEAKIKTISEETSADNFKNRKGSKSTTTKKSVFDKKPTQYKDLEEAALAVEALLEKLKREQAQSSNSGSMSSRLSGGAKMSTLRKSPLPANTPPVTNSEYTIGVESDSSPTAFGDEPTYYINGVQADRSDVDKIRKKDIINREIRTRNTQSGNPNGEVWYDVKILD